MAAKRYIAEDQFGVTWVVAAEDPAFPLLARLPRGYVRVLPRETFETGIIEPGRVEWATNYLSRLSRYDPEDPDIAALLGRIGAMHATLKFLVPEEDPVA